MPNKTLPSGSPLTRRNYTPAFKAECVRQGAVGARQTDMARDCGPDVAKRLVLNLLSVNKSSLVRSLLALALLCMLTGRVLFHMLRELHLDSPLTELNARRI